MRYSYFLKTIATYTYSSARIFDRELTVTEEYRADPSFSDDRLLEVLFETPQVTRECGGLPFIFSVDDKIAYARIDTPDASFLIGPTKFYVDPHLKLNINSGMPDYTEALSQNLPFYVVADFIEDVLLIYNAGRSGDESEPFLGRHAVFEGSVKDADKFTEAVPTLHRLIFDNVENNLIHNPYNHEKRQLDCIREGNPELLSEVLDENFRGRYGKLSNDAVKNQIYMGIVETTLASRAAIMGGLHPEIAYSLSDITIRKLDTCKNVIAASTISREIQLQFARLVREYRNDKRQSPGPVDNIHINHCKDYIFSHIHGKLTVHEIADAIGLEENYLSALFKQHENITLTSFITQEKIRIAKNLLIYSGYSFIEISNYLGFSSQSHFGQVFKKNTGTTPRAYRDAHASDDFIKDSMDIRKGGRLDDMTAGVSADKLP